MTDKIKKGQKGEKIAVNFLIARNYSIVERNYRYKRSEIDIIAKQEDVLVFVEVKARNHNEFGNPEEAVNDKKVKKVIEGAENYIIENDWRGRIRFDIIAVDLKTENVNHFEDAFG